YGPRGGFTIGGGAVVNSTSTSINRSHAFSQFLLGYYDAGGISSQPYGLLTGREWQFAGYARDRWQVNSNLTLTLGFRYEYYPLMKRADRGIERVDFNTPPGTLFNVLIGGLGTTPENAGIEVQKGFITPRVGLAYRFKDDTVVRAGYGMTVDPLPLSRPFRGPYPLTLATQFNGANAWTPFSTFAAGLPPVDAPDLSSGVIPLPPNVNVRTPPGGRIHRGYIQSWNFSIERKLPLDFVGEASYVGTQTTHQFSERDINAAAPGGGEREGNAARPFFNRGYTTSLNYLDGWTSANYHGLQTSLNRRFSRGVFIKAAYTFSKAINYTDDNGPASVLFNHVSVLDRNRALAGYDRTHNVQVGFSAELPFGAGKPWASEGIAGTILGGWQVNGVASAVSGTPFTVTANGASLDAPGNTQTADLVGDFKILGDIGSDKPWFDTTAFRPVTTQRFGTTGRNAFRGPGYGNIDLSLFRSFALPIISEKSTLQFRAEAFNITNTPRFDIPSANASATTFGTITTTLATVGSGSERFFRFGLRFGF
ncbi:MAG: TonB-dependent receptor, partial [Acidobacteriota bacterium]|nr:TonB-dependent receptor [Acidobacteriota bacterium]